MIVLDASAVVEYLLQSRQGRLITARLDDPDEVVHFPELLLVEVAQVLRRLVAADHVTPDRAETALTDLGDLAAIRHRHDELLPRMWELRNNLTAHDAAYIALAEALDAPLLSTDAKLAGAPNNSASVELVN